MMRLWSRQGLGVLAFVIGGISLYLFLVGLDSKYTTPDGSETIAAAPWGFAVYPLVWSVVLLGSVATGRRGLAMLVTAAVLLFSLMFLFSGGQFYLIPVVGLILIPSVDAWQSGQDRRKEGLS